MTTFSPKLELLNAPARAVDVPAFARTFQDWLHSGAAGRQLAMCFDLETDSHNLDVLQGEARYVSEADLYFVSRGMVDVLDYASPRLPLDTRIDRPVTNHGLVTLERPLKLWPHAADVMHGAYWRNGRALILLGQDGYPGKLITVTPPIVLDSAPQTRTTWSTAEQAAWRVIATAVLMMGERIAVPTHISIDRATRRRLQRLNLPIPAVQLVDLRRATQAETGGAPLSPVAWTRRWIVGGHWRRAWIPTANRHEPRWIAPHLKGPVDKPLICNERVHVWRR